jgi:hypothetical protein
VTNFAVFSFFMDPELKRTANGMTSRYTCTDKNCGATNALVIEAPMASQWLRLTHLIENKLGHYVWLVFRELAGQFQDRSDQLSREFEVFCGDLRQLLHQHVAPLVSEVLIHRFIMEATEKQQHLQQHQHQQVQQQADAKVGAEAHHQQQLHSSVTNRRQDIGVRHAVNGASGSSPHASVSAPDTPDASASVVDCGPGTSWFKSQVKDYENKFTAGKLKQEVAVMEEQIRLLSGKLVEDYQYVAALKPTWGTVLNGLQFQRTFQSLLTILKQLPQLTLRLQIAQAALDREPVPAYITPPGYKQMIDELLETLDSARKVMMSDQNTQHGRGLAPSATEERRNEAGAEYLARYRAVQSEVERNNVKLGSVTARARVAAQHQAGSDLDAPPDADPDVAEETHHTEIYADYAPAKLRVGKVHPDPVVESASLASIVPPDTPQEEKLLITDVVAKRHLSGLQLESIVYSLQRHELKLPSGLRAGFLVGDGAGVGKGRTIAGMILENYRRGRKRNIWVSVSQDLLVDSVRDLGDLVTHEWAKKQLIPLQKELPTTNLSNSYREGILFLTYSTLTAGQRGGKSRLDQIVDWCGGNAFEGVLVFDECHKAKNLVPEKGAKPTKTGKMVVEIQNLLPNARVVYASATGASMPRNMGYMERLGLWGKGLAIPDFESFVNDLASKGVGALELLAMDMKVRGMYVCRTLAFKGVEFDSVHVKIEGPDRVKYELATQFWIRLYDDFKQAYGVLNCINSDMGMTLHEILEPDSSPSRRGGQGRGRKADEERRNYDDLDDGEGDGDRETDEAADTPAVTTQGWKTPSSAAKRQKWGLSKVPTPFALFWGAHQRFFRALCMSAKVETVLMEAQMALQTNHAVVVGLQSTGEARTADYVEQAGGADALFQDFVSGPRELLNTLIDKYYPLPPKPFLEEGEEDSDADADADAVGDGTFTSPVKKEPGAGRAKPEPGEKREKKLRRKKKFAKLSPNEFDQLSDAYQKLRRMRDAALASVAGLDLPLNPLDEIIDRLGGPTKVAEMTGRKCRLVRQADGTVKMEPRNMTRASKHGKLTKMCSQEMVNIKERSLFQAGTKLVAIISEAASAGVSLHADRRAKNQRRRVHITLELPWAADKAIQQFGRSHRANQVRGPQYRLLFTDLGGERRFVAAVAARLESLGALTQGDRRAGPGGQQLRDFNCQSSMGREALKKLYTLAYTGYAFGPNPVLPDECTPNHPLHEKVSEATGGKPYDVSRWAAETRWLLASVGLTEVDIDHIRIGYHADPGLATRRFSCKRIDGDDEGAEDVRWQLDTSVCPRRSRPPQKKQETDIPRFLNRLLGLPPHAQDSLFGFFQKLLDHEIATAKKMGTFDEGIMSLKGNHVRITEGPEVVYQDPASQATTMLAAVEVDRGVSWEEVLAIKDEWVAPTEGMAAPDNRHDWVSFYKTFSSAFGGPLVVLAVFTKGLIRGSQDGFKLVRPITGLALQPVVASEFLARYTPITDDEARPMWIKFYLESGKAPEERRTFIRDQRKRDKMALEARKKKDLEQSLKIIASSQGKAEVAAKQQQEDEEKMEKEEKKPHADRPLEEDDPSFAYEAETGPRTKYDGRRFNTYYMLGGVVVPVWDCLVNIFKNHADYLSKAAQKVQVVRAQTTGVVTERVIGVLIPSEIKDEVIGQLHARWQETEKDYRDLRKPDEPSAKALEDAARRAAKAAKEYEESGDRNGANGSLDHDNMKQRALADLFNFGEIVSPRKAKTKGKGKGKTMDKSKAMTEGGAPSAQRRTGRGGRPRPTNVLELSSDDDEGALNMEVTENEMEEEDQSLDLESEEEEDEGNDEITDVVTDSDAVSSDASYASKDEDVPAISRGPSGSGEKTKKRGRSLAPTPAPAPLQETVLGHNRRPPNVGKIEATLEESESVSESETEYETPSESEDKPARKVQKCQKADVGPRRVYPTRRSAPMGRRSALAEEDDELEVEVEVESEIEDVDVDKGHQKRVSGRRARASEKVSNRSESRLAFLLSPPLVGRDVLETAQNLKSAAGRREMVLELSDTESE